jgi:hypothetical protein
MHNSVCDSYISTSATHYKHMPMRPYSSCVVTKVVSETRTDKHVACDEIN